VAVVWMHIVAVIGLLELLERMCMHLLGTSLLPFLLVQFNIGQLHYKLKCTTERLEYL